MFVPCNPPCGNNKRLKVFPLLLIHSSSGVQSEKEEAEARNQPDDEGWVTVGRGGRNPAAPRLDAAELQERRRKKKKVRLKYMRCNKTNFTIQKLL